MLMNRRRGRLRSWLCSTHILMKSAWRNFSAQDSSSGGVGAMMFLFKLLSQPISCFSSSMGSMDFLCSRVRCRLSASETRLEKLQVLLWWSSRCGRCSRSSVRIDLYELKPQDTCCCFALLFLSQTVLFWSLWFTSVLHSCDYFRSVLHSSLGEIEPSPFHPLFTCRKLTWTQFGFCGGPHWTDVEFSTSIKKILRPTQQTLSLNCKCQTYRRKSVMQE